VPGADALLGVASGLERAVGEVADRLGRVTVHIRPGGRSAGAGVIWRRDGLVVTNAHVATGPEATVLLPNERELHARVVARDPRRDLALLRIAAPPLEAALHADARGLRPGELVIALGHPFGVPYAAALGVVHRAPSAERGPGGWLHADIRLAPGNSGGPLADVAGRIVGINAMIVNGLGIAVPTHVVERFVREALAERRPGGGVRAA
jgi:serine protease Do